MLILVNTFHGTSYKTRRSRSEVDLIAERPAEELADDERVFARRVRRHLCGHPGCTCATNALGERDR